MPDINELSEREREILELVATGASNKEIAQKLYISTNTVKVHLRNIFAKIGVATRTEAAMVAVQAGLVQPAAPEGLIVDDDHGGEPAEQIDAGQAVPEHVSAQPPFWQTAASWVGLAALLLLALVGVWAVTNRQVPTQASSSPPAPTELPRWRVRANMPTERSGLAIAAYDNQVYVIGGEGSAGILGVVESYNPESDTWNEHSSKPTPAADISAGLVSGKIYVPGGRLADGSVTDRLEIYDPAADTWDVGAPLPASLSAYALIVYEGKLYLFGGWNGSQYVASVFRYDPGLNDWTTLTPMPTARGLAGAAATEQKIYVIGGTDGKQALNVNEVYTPSRENGTDAAWSSADPMPEGRYAMGVTSIVDILYTLGGKSDANGQVVSFQYTPSQDSWAEFQRPESQPWSSMGVVLLGTQLYLIGGQLDGLPTGQNLAYQAIYTIAIPSIIK